MRDESGPPGWIRDSSLFTEAPVVMYVAVGLMGTINGLFAGGVGYYLDTTVLNLHAAVWLFLLGWIGTTTYLSYKRVPSGVLAVGLYFIALFVFLQPIMAYGSELTAAGQASGTTRAHLMLTSWQGILTWGVLSGVLALTIMFVSRLLNRHAQRVVSRRLKRDMRQDTND